MLPRALLPALAILAGLLGGGLAAAPWGETDDNRHLASYYGHNTGYDWSGSVTAAGEPFNPWRVDRAATPLRPDDALVWPLGTRLLVCSVDRPPAHPLFGVPAGCTRLLIDDTCPGCWERGFALDLTAGAYRHITGRTPDFNVAQVHIWQVP